MELHVSHAQIDRLGIRLRDEAVTPDDLRALDAYRLSFADAFQAAVDVIRRETRIEPTLRPAKSTSSIIEKLQRETVRLSQMQDIAGCRLVVPNRSTQDMIVGQLTVALEGIQVIDRRESPSHGYRAVHLITVGKPVEIQVRTELQHLWAEISEKLADILDPTLKYGGGPEKVRQWLDLMSDVVGWIETRELALEFLVAQAKQRALTQNEVHSMSEAKAYIQSGKAELETTHRAIVAIASQIRRGDSAVSD